MRGRALRGSSGITLALLAATIAATIAVTRAGAEPESVPFDSPRWTVRNAETTEYLGRPCLQGFAYLADVDFADGVIEVDLAVTGQRGYPGLVFRVQSEENYENVYVRPHVAGVFANALQYTPVINQVACWQLYHGDGCTAAVDIPKDRWVPLRLEIAGTQARLFVDGAETPALIMHDLKHGNSRGGIGVSGETNGTSFFSDFRYDPEAKPHFEPLPAPEIPPGTLTDWELSQGFKYTRVDLETPCDEQDLGPIEWRRVACEPSGLVNVTRTVSRAGREPDVVFARTILTAEGDETRRLSFGYSDLVSIFLNGRLLFIGNSAYRQRDTMFQGVVGPNDLVTLDLHAGRNELVLTLAESFGGWGFLCRDGDAIFLRDDVEKLRESGKVFLTPESVLYDEARDVFYVSNYDVFGRAPAESGQHISRLAANGEVETAVWVTGLRAPTGLALAGDTLYVVERRSLAAIDVERGEILVRHAIPGARFPNDVAVAADGTVYVSDSGRSAILRFASGEFEVWLEGGEIGDPNALCVHGETLLVGNNGDDCLKAIGLEDKSVRTVVRFWPGIIDGIQIDGDDNILVSQFAGKVYRVSNAGEIEKLLDTSVGGANVSDFDYVAERNLLVTPTFLGDQVVCYRLSS
jgi:DNA-binding beta-propeller fold protein YncE